MISGGKEKESKRGDLADLVAAATSGFRGMARQGAFEASLQQGPVHASERIRTLFISVAHDRLHWPNFDFLPFTFYPIFR
jgi:hypothetical protein